MNRLVFVIGTMGNGGAERVVATLSNAFVLKNIDVRIITIYGDQKDYVLNDAVDLCPIKCKSKIRVFRPIERILTIRKLISGYNPDCVISFLADVNIHTILSMTGRSTPLIVSERNNPEKDPENKYKRFIRNHLYKRADGFVFQTRDAMNYFDDVIPFNKPKKIIFNPLAPNLPFNNAGVDNRRLITACRLYPQKNLPLLINSVSAVIKDGIDCTLDIYGKGPMYDELESLIMNSGMANNIFLKGFSNNIYEEIQTSCSFVISSDYEGLSNSMLEALAIGTPVIATDCPVGGARQFIDNYINGILTPVGNQAELSKAIEFVLNNPLKAKRMGEKATQIRKQLDAKTITNEWLSFIESIVLSKKDRHHE